MSENSNDVKESQDERFSDYEKFHIHEFVHHKDDHYSKTEMQSLLDPIEEDLINLDSALEDLQIDITDIEIKTNDQENDITNIMVEQESLKTDMVVANTNINILESSIESVETSVLENDTKIENLKSDIPNLVIQLLAAKKEHIVIWAEENGSLVANNFEWSFGNGTENRGNYGFPMPVDGRIKAASISVMTNSGGAPAEVRVSITVNGTEKTDYQIVNPSGNFSSVKSFVQNPLELTAGNRINFRSKTSNSSVTHGMISVLIELDIPTPGSSSQE